ncbi:unnamed protein product [Orchesella dallaii]|uniref:F-box domain-containing protein n=1 Tax=Orchesella dallaii TaxID=48710 RepID=A0ABP1PNE9_9HEXA
MEGAIEKLPNEMLCLVLDYLDNKDKLHVMSVCKRWKEQIDKNVRFSNVILTDETYEFVRKTFGHRRVKSIRIYDYSKTESPFTNLDFLETLTVSALVPENALTAILTMANKLKPEGLIFYDIILKDKTYEAVTKRFGHCRVSSMSINNYSRTENPFTNLESLRELNIGECVSDNLLAVLLRNAVNLQKVSVAAHHGCITPTELLHQCGNHQRISPAACSAKRLEVTFDEGYDPYWNPRRFGPWNAALDYAMPNVEELYFKSFVIYDHPGLDIFWLLASKPRLCTLEILLRKGDMPSSRELQPLVVTNEMNSALAQVRLTSLTFEFLNEHVGAWEVILSSQTHLRELKMHDINGIGFNISIILPLLTKCTDTLSSIDLKIDAKLNSKIDLQIFSHLKILESLELEVCDSRMVSSKKLPNRVNVPTVENISKIFTKHLVCLGLRGFEFSEEDVINSIIIESKRGLDVVDVGNDFLSIWKSFKSSLPKMGIEYCRNVEPSSVHYTCIASRKKYNRNRFSMKILVFRPKFVYFKAH